MKCPNCQSLMLVTDKTSSARSHVIFYRCSLCISEHVSSEPNVESTGYDLLDYRQTSVTEQKRFLMV